ncbi:MIND complex subunit NSL1 SCDLUD_001148 [Saccharomycodes ludwigii]|uniref:MIND complex subunit NSL1 n=1 Tax=Saccharomycodes ludwigii TaxID=36035 RepID=UPI001E831F03|nr:hypothetical protein SCDLUD_001148 [Saccharomycodes ludwigii]KAH3903507.1 hypothetical protein SCDLUD_001148 [Saccharomycodes ludwigii]
MPREKISLSLTEFQTIYSQLRDNLGQRLVKSLPQQTNDDIVRSKAENYLQKYLLEAMEMAYKSLDIEQEQEQQEEYTEKEHDIRDILLKDDEKDVEPFDLELNEKVRKLYQDWETEVVNVTQLRKNGPRRLGTELDGLNNKLLERIDNEISDASHIASTDNNSVEFSIKDDDNSYSIGIKELNESSQELLGKVKKNQDVLGRKKDFVERNTQFKET